MNIGELDIDKLKQCVINEKNRLTDIDATYNKVYNEYAKWLESVEEKKKEREAHFESLKNSRIGAQKFIEDCETRLNEIEI